LRIQFKIDNSKKEEIIKLKKILDINLNLPNVILLGIKRRLKMKFSSLSLKTKIFVLNILINTILKWPQMISMNLRTKNLRKVGKNWIRKEAIKSLKGHWHLFTKVLLFIN
jgi:hypothetical protein